MCSEKDAGFRGEPIDDGTGDSVGLLEIGRVPDPESTPFGKRPVGPVAALETSIVLDTPLGGDAALDSDSAFHEPAGANGVRHEFDGSRLQGAALTKETEFDLRFIADSREVCIQKNLYTLHCENEEDFQDKSQRSNALRAIPTGFASGCGRQLNLATNEALERAAQLLCDPTTEKISDRGPGLETIQPASIPTGFASGCGRQLNLATNEALERAAQLLVDENEDPSLSRGSSTHKTSAKATSAEATPPCISVSRSYAPLLGARSHAGRCSSGHRNPQTMKHQHATGMITCTSQSARIQRIDSLCESSSRGAGICDRSDTSCHPSPVRGALTLDPRHPPQYERDKAQIASHFGQKRPQAAELPRIHHKYTKHSNSSAATAEAERIHPMALQREGASRTEAPGAASISARHDANPHSTQSWTPNSVPRWFPRPPPVPTSESRRRSLVIEPFPPWEALCFRFRASRNDSHALIASVRSNRLNHSVDDLWSRFSSRMRSHSDIIGAWEVFQLFCPETATLELDQPTQTDNFWSLTASDLEPAYTRPESRKTVGSMSWFRRYWCLIVYKLALVELAAPRAWHGRVLTFWNVLFQLVWCFWHCHRRAALHRSESFFNAIARSPHAFKYLPPTELLVVALHRSEQDTPAERLRILLCDGHALVWAICDGPRDAWLERLRLCSCHHRCERRGPRTQSASCLQKTPEGKAGRLYVAGARVDLAGDLDGQPSACLLPSKFETPRVSLVLSLNNSHVLPLLYGTLQSKQPMSLAMYRSLGRVRHAFRSVTLSQAHHEGGPVPALDVVLHRVYPLRFLVEQQQEPQTDVPTANSRSDAPSESGWCVWSASSTAAYIEHLQQAQREIWPVHASAWTRQQVPMAGIRADVSPYTHLVKSGANTHDASLTETRLREHFPSSGTLAVSASPFRGTLLTLVVSDRTGEVRALVQLRACSHDMAQLLRQQYEGRLIRLRYVGPVAARCGLWRLLGSAQLGVNLLPLSDHAANRVRSLTSSRNWIHWPRQQLRVSALATLATGDEFDAAPGLRLLHLGIPRRTVARQAIRYVYAADDPDGPLLIVALRHEDAEFIPRCLHLGHQRPYCSGVHTIDPYPLIHFEQCRYRHYDAAVDAHVVDGTVHTTWSQRFLPTGAFAESVEFAEIAAVAARIAQGHALGEPFIHCRQRRSARIATHFASVQINRPDLNDTE
jgi:hypothetical protein